MLSINDATCNNVTETKLDRKVNLFLIFFCGIFFVVGHKFSGEGWQSKKKLAYVNVYFYYSGLLNNNKLSSLIYNKIFSFNSYDFS